MTSIDITQLLEPIPGDAPCGPRLRHEPAWDRLKELRREDDASLPAGVWQAELKRGDWAALEHLASELLRERSKDLMIAAWLGEAWLHRHGLFGIAPALQLLVELCEHYPDELHPQPEEGDRSWRVPPLEWMVRRYSNLLLTQVAVFGGDNEEVAQLTLHQWKRLQARQVQASDNKQDKVAAESARMEQRKYLEAIRQLPGEPLRGRLQALDGSLVALQRFEAWSDAWLAEQAPSFAPLRQVLEDIRHLVQEFAPMSSDTPPISPVPVDAAPVGAPQQAVAPLSGAVPGSREEAYRQLSLIADYLARSEPHSPVPYVIRRVVEWGQQPLSELLEELLSSDAESRRVWKLLGVLK